MDRPLVAMSISMAVSLLICLPLRHGLVHHGMMGHSLFATLESVLVLKFLPLFFMGIPLNEIKNKQGTVKSNLVESLVAATVFHAIDDHDYNPVATVLLLGILALSAYGKLPLLRFKPLVFISTISYSLYLVHNNLGSTIIYHLNHLGVRAWASFLLTTGIVVAISTASTHLIELPLANWMRGQYRKLKQSGIFQRRVSAAKPA
jgi:peptidoglycan/LPS O-acetylase OafA/YrhL